MGVIQKLKVRGRAFLKGTKMCKQVGFLDGILRELRFWSKFEKSKKSEIKGCGA